MSMQMTLHETETMKDGCATLHSCQQCGSILFVPSQLGRRKREWDGDCPACGKRLWKLMRHGEGPFKWAEA